MANIIVVGAGIGGLTSAALLARDGHNVSVYEKASRPGGRTTSTRYKNHILDNGFHIMPFYKKSAVYNVLKVLGIQNRIKLVGVSDIAFYAGGSFHKYPKGISDILSMSMVPFRSRILLLRLLLPMAFSSIKSAENLDGVSLSSIIQRLDPRARVFFDAICMLAFADTPDRIALGEFVRTIIRANPFRGGTSQFAYPSGGGYDTICRILASYVVSNGGVVNLSSPVKHVEVKNERASGITDASGEYREADCVIVSLPAYQATGLFRAGVIRNDMLKYMDRLNETTSVVEVHYGTSRRIDTRQVVFPVGLCAAKGVFFTSNISPSICPPGEHQIISGTPVSAEQASRKSDIMEIAGQMRQDIETMYPGFSKDIIWERPMAWRLVEAVVKKPGMVWKSKMPHSIPYIKGLFFVGDSTVSYGIGTDSAAHSSVLCRPQVLQYLASLQ